MRRVSTLATVLALLGAMLATAPASRADPAIAVVAVPITTSLDLSGTVVYTSAEAVRIRTASGLVAVIPAPLAVFHVGTVTTPPLLLAIGSPVHVVLQPMPQATLVRVSDSLIILHTLQGDVTVPVAILPADVQARTMVSVRLRNGNIVSVPLNAALNMQRAQGAVIMVKAPPAVRVQGKVVPPGKVTAPARKGGGKGQGHGKPGGHR